MSAGKSDGHHDLSGKSDDFLVTEFADAISEFRAWHGGDLVDHEAAGLAESIGLVRFDPEAVVLTGVVEEKSSRVVEVLLARMPATDLLAGKVIGIGLLGLAQIAVTALAALAALQMVDSLDMPAACSAVLAWFVLGYALYATVYGALGSLASRTEDAQAIAGLATIGARVYTGAVLHTGPTLKLRQAWRATTTSAPGATGPAG